MNVIDWLEENWNINPELFWKVVLSIGAVLVLYAIRFVAIQFLYTRLDSEDAKGRYLWKRTIKNTYYLLTIFVLGALWLEQFGSFATFLGLFSAGLAIALKDPLMNFAGWLFIVLRKPLQLGDRIQIGEYAGDVIDIRFFQFTINEINNWVDADQSTGRIIHIPNGMIFTHPQANYTQGFSHIWNEISVMITFESNWEHARKVMEEILNERAEKFSFSAKRKLIEASKKFMIFYGTLTPYVYVAIEQYGVKLTMRYLVDPRKRRASENEMWMDMLRLFSKASDIAFAYPTTRFYSNTQEGKSGTGGPDSVAK